VYQVAGCLRVLLLRALRVALSLRSLTNTARWIRTAFALQSLHRLPSLVVGGASLARDVLPVAVGARQHDRRQANMTARVGPMLELENPRESLDRCM